MFAGEVSDLLQFLVVKVMQILPMRKVMQADSVCSRPCSGEVPMLDKNQFKEAFRRFVDGNPAATEHDAMDFCQSLIPAHRMAADYWLVDQCLQWFRWLQTQPGRVGYGPGGQTFESGALEEETH